MFLFIGHSFSECIESLLNNERMRLMFLPDETSNQWYGETVKPGEPNTISYPYQEIR